MPTRAAIVVRPDARRRRSPHTMPGLWQTASGRVPELFMGGWEKVLKPAGE